jgi:hypothetical protein
MQEEQAAKIQKLEEVMKGDLSEKYQDILKKSSQNVLQLQEKYDEKFDKMSKRMGLHEHQVTELQVAHEQNAAYKRKKIEKLEKELLKL